MSSSTAVKGFVLNGSRATACTATKKTASRVCINTDVELPLVCENVYGVPFAETDEVSSVCQFSFAHSSRLLKSPVFVKCTKKQLSQHVFIGSVSYSVPEPVEEDDEQEEEDDDAVSIHSCSDDENENSDDQHAANMEDLESDEEDEMSDFE